jgi:hypothetical protein
MPPAPGTRLVIVVLTNFRGGWSDALFLFFVASDDLIGTNSWKDLSAPTRTQTDTNDELSDFQSTRWSKTFDGLTESFQMRNRLTVTDHVNLEWGWSPL